MFDGEYQTGLYNISLSKLFNLWHNDKYDECDKCDKCDMWWCEYHIL